MKQWLQSHPEARSGIRVAVYVFLTQFGLALLGFLKDVQAWASSVDAVAFPVVSPLGKAAVAALSAAITGMVAFGYNKLPSTTTARYPQEPQPDAEARPDRGESTVVTIVAVLAAVALVIWIVKQ